MEWLVKEVVRVTPPWREQRGWQIDDTTLVVSWRDGSLTDDTPFTCFLSVGEEGPQSHEINDELCKYGRYR